MSNRGREEANLNMIANAMGPQLSNLMYRTASGRPFYEEYGGEVALPSGLGNSQTAAGNEYRYAQEQVKEFNQSGGQQTGQFSNQVAAMGAQQYGQPTQEFSGYGQPAPNYNTGLDRSWTVSSQRQPNQDYYNRLPKVFGHPIVGVRKDGRGNIEAFKLSTGHVLDYAQMLEANNQGAFSGLRVQANQEGELIIRSVPDGYTDNNLDNLPQF